MAKFYKVCCGIRRVGGEYDYLLKKVKGTPYPLDEHLFTYTRRGVYYLVDIDTGLELKHFNYWQDLEDWYIYNKGRYLMCRESSSYKDKVKKLRQLEEAQ